MNEQEAYEKYKDQIEELNVKFYNKTFDEDLLLLNWWIYLNEIGDISKIFPDDSHRLGAFMEFFSTPTVLMYSLNPQNKIEFTFWLKDQSATNKTTFVGIWFSPEIRGTRHQLKLASLVYNLTFEFYESILGLTWQINLLQMHMKMGYKVVGNIPNFMGHEQTWLVRLTKGDFCKSQVTKIGQKIREKKNGC